MSVRSLKTAVNWANPLREKDQVFSRPGMPASATSMGKVTCFSISKGDRAGAKALIWTWTLVISGTASIGSLVSDHAPHAAAATVKSRTSHRFRTEKARTRSIIARSILGQRFQQLGLEQECIAHGNHLARAKPRHHLDDAVVALTEDHLTLLESLRRASKSDRPGPHVLNGACRHDKRERLFLERDRCGDEGAGPPHAIDVCELGDDP